MRAAGHHALEVPKPPHTHTHTKTSVIRSNCLKVALMWNGSVYHSSPALPHVAGRRTDAVPRPFHEERPSHRSRKAGSHRNRTGRVDEGRRNH